MTDRRKVLGCQQELTDQDCHPDRGQRVVLVSPQPGALGLESVTFYGCISYREKEKRPYRITVKTSYHPHGGGILGEWSMVFRFGHYLQNKLNKFPEYRSLSLDSEYNRHGYNSKLDLELETIVRPDLFLHERRSNNENLLVIEFKKDELNGSDNLKKLKMFTKPIAKNSPENQGYGYRFGLFIAIAEEEFHYEPQFPKFLTLETKMGRK